MVLIKTPGLDIDRNPSVLHERDRFAGIPTAHQGTVEIDERQHDREEPLQGDHIGHAIGQEGKDLFGGVMAAAHGQSAHLGLFT